MTDFNTVPDTEAETEHYPLEPRYHPVHRLTRMIYDFLASAKLAMALLIVILVCCVVGVTVWREARAGAMIFGTLWFNGILVLLVVNVACCFFGRIWHRKLTVITFGMILFHLSFVTVFAGIIYNSLFYFRGTIRLTEGETLPNGDLGSYDLVDKGRFFRTPRLKGETTLVRMHTGYKVKGEDKRAAYEVAIGEGTLKQQGIIYITHNMDYKGFKYLPEKEGYSVLVVLYDKQGREVYGAYVPLQSIRQGENSYLYTTGTKDGPGNFPFPQAPGKPLFAPQLAYVPSPLKERTGDVMYKVWALAPGGESPSESLIAEGKAKVGESFSAGAYQLSVKEVRYWVAMNVRYEPGKPIVLASLWVGLGGMIITTLGRMMKRRSVAAA